METLKKIFCDIGVPYNDNQINDFLKRYEKEITGFFQNLIDSQLVADTSNANTQPTDAPLPVDAPQPTDAQLPVEPPKPPDTQPQVNPPKPTEKEKAANEAMIALLKKQHIIFPNGKVMQEYEADFDGEKFNFAEVSFEGLEKIGLQYFPEEKKIKGTPTEAGDHKITLQVKFKGSEERPPLPREVTLIINQDPRVLWNKNIPTPEDIEYYKPDSDKLLVKVAAKIESKYAGLKKIEIPRKDMVVASQRGRSHAIEGKPRDDDFALHFDEETECYIMIVADGAGSAKYSRRGSQVACETAMRDYQFVVWQNKERYHFFIYLGVPASHRTEANTRRRAFRYYSSL